MAYCETCEYWRKEYDDFRQDFNDEIVVNDKSRPPHFCIMYDDHIPPSIYYDGEKCKYREQKEST